MSRQAHTKNSKYFQGRGNQWTDRSRGAQQPMVNDVSDSDIEGVYSNPHMAHALTTLIGCVVAVKTTDGTVYEGVLRAVSPNMDVSLNAAYDKSKVLSRENVKKILELKFNCVVNISKMETSSPLAIDIFRTDTEISKSNGGSSNRELKRFTDFADTGDSLDMEKCSGWSAEEMFSVNREKFQVTSNFDENLSQYTTELNRDGEGYLRRAARARQIANEIEGKNSHGSDDVGTEEELFSSVVRGDQAPPTSSQLHTPTQPISSTHTPDTASPNITSNQPSDTVTSDQPSSSSSSSDILLSTVAIGNDTNVMTTKIESSLSTKDIDNIVSDTYNVTVSEATRSAASATAEESEVKIEGAAVETVPPFTRESPTTSKDTPTTTPTSEAKDVSEVTSSSEDPPAAPDSTTSKNLDASSSKSTFKLNPNAKEFRFNPNAVEFKPPTASLPTVVTVTSSTPPSPSQVSSTSSSVTTYHHTGRHNNRQYKRPRQPTSSQNMYPASDYILQSMPQSGGFVIPQGSMVGGMVRPGQIMTPPGNQVLFPSHYQLPSGQPGVINTFSPHVQQVVPGAALNAQQQQIMLAPIQQQQQQLYQQQILSQQPGLLTAGGQPGVGQGGVLPGGGAVLPGASQGQPYQQVIYTPQGGQVIYTPPMGVVSGGGATPLVVSAGTVPLHSTVQAQSLISAVNPTQPPVFSPSRGNYPLHPPGK